MKCVIFGGGGFIGSAIADRLLKDGHELRIFERPRVLPYRQFSASEKVEWVTGDLLSIHDVTDAVTGMDAVLHLVSFTLPKSSNDDILYDIQTNVVATVQLLNTMLAQNVKRILFISSGGTVYGVPQYIPIDENHPTDPMVSYGVTKLMIEKYLLMYQRLHGIRPIILRVSNPYGPRQRVETAQGAATVFLYKALHNLPVEIWGDGSIIRDYIYISDVAEAFAMALNYEGHKNIFNISSGRGTSLNDLIVEIEKVLERKISTNYMDARPFDVPVSVLSNVLAAHELKWSPQVDFNVGIAYTRDWFEDHETGATLI
jgi:UDP-glucose 4-epimerase